jgi:hypothetical protein
MTDQKYGNCSGLKAVKKGIRGLTVTERELNFR